MQKKEQPACKLKLKLKQHVVEEAVETLVPVALVDSLSVVFRVVQVVALLAVVVLVSSSSQEVIESKSYFT
jgi:hypothetical protein